MPRLRCITYRYYNNFFCNVKNKRLVGLTTETLLLLGNTCAMEEEYGAFIDEWPRISFEAIANEEVEGGAIRGFYKSFFAILNFPEMVARSFMTSFKGTQS